MVDIFAWDIDFFTETRVGDRFRVVVEKRFVDGKLIGYGRLLAAEYALSEARRTHRAFRYAFEDGRVGYYEQDGTAVEKAYLKSPVKFASITSRYGFRRHPILKYVRAHRGVDYAAPRGTAIWAIASGSVKYAGRRGGYGGSSTCATPMGSRRGMRIFEATVGAFEKAEKSGRSR